MTKMILVATKPNEQIYWVADARTPDGVVVRHGNIVHLDSFWNYIASGVDPITRLGGTAFLDDFWDSRGPSGAERFSAIYVERSEPVDTDIAKTMTPFLVDVPKAYRAPDVSDAMAQVLNRGAKTKA